MCSTAKSMHRPVILIVCTTLIVALVVGAAYYDLPAVPSSAAAVGVAGIALYVAVDMNRAHKKKVGLKQDDACGDGLHLATHKKTRQKICIPDILYDNQKSKLKFRRDYDL